MRSIIRRRFSIVFIWKYVLPYLYEFNKTISYTVPLLPLLKKVSSSLMYDHLNDRMKYTKNILFVFPIKYRPNNSTRTDVLFQTCSEIYEDCSND